MMFFDHFHERIALGLVNSLYAKKFVVVAAMAMSLGAAAAHAQQPTEQSSADILVTAERLSDLVASFEACQSSGCPPDERMRRGIRAADALFVAGDYVRARSVLRRANVSDAEAARHPVLAAGLRRALARVAGHLGDTDTALRGTFGIARALKAGLPAGDWRIAYAGLEQGDLMLKLRRVDQARLLYRAQLEAPYPVATLALLRLAMLDTLQGRPDTARSRLREVAAATDERMAPFALAARVLLARIEPKGRRDAAVDAVIAAARASPGERPRLLLGVPVDLGPTSEVDASGTAAVADARRSAMPDVNGTWADVLFRVTPEGTVADPAVLRSQGDDWWHQAVLAAVGRRIYSAFISADPDGLYKVERFSLTSWKTPAAGSRIARRDGVIRVESLDLTRR